jgi:hypothetical protein
VSWEKLPGTAEHRALVPHGKLMALDDVFGEVRGLINQSFVDQLKSNKFVCAAGGRCSTTPAG